MKDIDLILGDSLDYIRRIEDNTIDLIITDPPYDIHVTPGGGSLTRVKKIDKFLGDIEDVNIHNGYNMEAYNKEFVRIMKDINIYIWCSKKQIPLYFNYYINELNCKFEIISWHKINALPTYSNKYLTDTEYCLYFHNGKAKCQPNSYEDAKTFYLAGLNQRDKSKYRHPTIKPLDITEKFIRNSSNAGDVVLDVFMGSGTTGVAAKKLGRKFIGIEINEEFYNIAKDRLDEVTFGEEKVVDEFFNVEED